MYTSMFCCQCESDSGGSGCKESGVQREAPGNAALQDLLIYVLKDMARFHYRGRDREGINPAHSQSSTESGPATIRRVALDTTDAPLQAMVGQGLRGGLVGDGTRLGTDAAGLTELLLYGLKGTAAYAHHARTLGREAEEVDLFLERGLDTLASGRQEAWEVLALCRECTGAVSLEAADDE